MSFNTFELAHYEAQYGFASTPWHWRVALHADDSRAHQLRYAALKMLPQDVPISDSTLLHIMHAPAMLEQLQQVAAYCDCDTASQWRVLSEFYVLFAMLVWLGIHVSCWHDWCIGSECNLTVRSSGVSNDPSAN